MQNTENPKSNEERADNILTELSATHKRLGAIRKEVSMIEYGLIKDVLEQNPTIAKDINIRADVREEEKQSLSSYLDSVVPTPAGYKNPAMGVNSNQVQERVRASMAHILAGKSVSDDKLLEMRDSLKDMQSIYSEMETRRDNYNSETYDKTMVNPTAIQENIDGGKTVFKKSQQLVLHATVNSKDNNMQSFAVERNSGNDGQYPSYSFPTNETAFSPVYGNPFTAKAILVVAADLQNKKINEGRQSSVDKSPAVPDNDEAALLAHMINIKGHDTTKQDYAVVVVDTRSLEGFMNKVDQVNPNATLKLYSNTQTEDLESINRKGQKQKIGSTLKQAFEWAKGHATSPENALDKALIIKNSKDSLADIVAEVKKGAQERYPDDDYQQRTLIQDTYKDIKNKMDDMGAQVVDKFLQAYKGHKNEMDNDLITKKNMTPTEQLEQRIIDASRNSRVSKMEISHNKELERQAPDAEKPSGVDPRQQSLIDDNSAPAAQTPRPSMR